MTSPIFFVAFGIVLGFTSMPLFNKLPLISTIISFIGVLFAFGGGATILVTDILGEGGAIPVIPQSMEMLAAIVFVSIIFGICSSFAGYMVFIKPETDNK